MFKNQTEKMLRPEKKSLRKSVRSTCLMILLATVMSGGQLFADSVRTVITPWTKQKYNGVVKNSRKDYRQYLEKALESAKKGMRFSRIENKRDLDWFESVVESFFRKERNNVMRLKLHPESEKSRLSTLQTLESETTAAYIQQKIEIVRKIEEEDAIAARAIQKARSLRGRAPVRRKG